jgi:hypothetical protein
MVCNSSFIIIIVNFCRVEELRGVFADFPSLAILSLISLCRTCKRDLRDIYHLEGK